MRNLARGGLTALLSLTVLQTGYVPAERDVDAFEERAARYEQGGSVSCIVRSSARQGNCPCVPSQPKPDP